MIWFWILIGAAALLILADIAVSAALFMTSIPRKRLKFGPLDHAPSGAEANEKRNVWRRSEQEAREWAETVHSEELRITSGDGLRLYATWFPAENACKTVVCLHGYLSNGYNDFGSLLKFYHDAGLNVLLVDQRAHNRSEGRHIGFGVLERYDCRRWIEFLNGRGVREIYLHGISMGASAALMASGLELPENVRGIIADCGFTSAWDEFAGVLKAVYRLPEFPVLHTASLICKIFAGYGFRDVSTLDIMRAQKRPVLFIHGDADNFVPTWMTLKNHDACIAPKRLLITKNAAHGESRFAEPERFISAISDFTGINKEAENVE